MSRFEGPDRHPVDAIQWLGNRDAARDWLAGFGEVEGADGLNLRLPNDEPGAGEEDEEGSGEPVPLGSFLVVKTETEVEEEKPKHDWAGTTRTVTTTRALEVIPRDEFMSRYRPLPSSPPGANV